MLLQTNSYIVPPDKRSEHLRLVRRFRQTLARLGCDHFEVYEQVGANWGSAESAGRFVQILRFVDRKHQLAVQSAERTDPGAQAVIAEFCELINFPYQQEQGLFAVSFYSGVLPPISKRAGQDEPGSAAESAAAEDAGDAHAMPSGEVAGEAVMDAGVSAKSAAEPDELKPAELEHAELEPADLEPADLEPADLEPADLEPAELDPAEPESAELEPTALEPPITPAVAEPASGFVPIEDELDRTLESQHSREADESPRMGHMKLVQDEPADEPVDGKLAEAETYGRIEPAAIEPAAEAEPLEEFEHSEFEHSEFEHPGIEHSEIEQIEELEPEEEEEFTPVSISPVSSTPVSNGHAVLHEPEPEIRPIGESLGELAEEDDFHLMPEPQTLSAFTPELPAEHAAEAEAEPMHHESLLTSEHESAEELVSTDELSPVVSDEVASDEVVSDEPVETHPAHHPRHEDDFMTLIQGELTEEDEERAHGFIEGELVDDLENEHLNGLSGHVKHADELTGHEVRPPKQNAPW